MIRRASKNGHSLWVPSSAWHQLKNVPLFLPFVSHFQTGVKSELHCVHANGMGGEGILVSFVRKSTTCSNPTRYMNSVLLGLGMKCISGGGGLGGGICKHNNVHHLVAGLTCWTWPWLLRRTTDLTFAGTWSFRVYLLHCVKLSHNDFLSDNFYYNAINIIGLEFFRHSFFPVSKNPSVFLLFDQLRSNYFNWMCWKKKIDLRR